MNQKKEYYLITGVILLGTLSVIFMGIVDGTWRKTQFTDFQDDQETYNMLALQLAKDGTYREEISSFRRAPGYPAFLAILYRFITPSPLIVYAAQSALFMLSIILLWSLVSYLFPYPYRLVPPLLLALSWFAALSVTKVIPEILSLFLLLLALWCFERCLSSRRISFTIGTGGALSWFLLIKPVALAFMPFIILLFAVRAYFIFPRARGAALATVFLVLIPAVIVGGWIARGAKKFNSYQIQSGAMILEFKSREATAPWKRIFASFTAGLAGDIVADSIIPGYSDNPDPYYYIDPVARENFALDAKGYTEAEKELLFTARAKERILKNPAKFIVAGITGILRQNAPMNHKGNAIIHMFSRKSHPDIPYALKITTLVALRVLWYGFLAFVLTGILKERKNWQTYGMFALWIILYNGMNGFFSHNEARYIIPVWPLYLIFATTTLMYLKQQRSARQNKRI